MTKKDALLILQDIVNEVDERELVDDYIIHQAYQAILTLGKEDHEG